MVTGGIHQGLLLPASVLAPEGLAQTSMSEGVVAVEGQGTLEDVDGVIDVFRLVVVLQVATSLEIELVSTCALRAVALEVLALLRG